MYTYQGYYDFAIRMCLEVVRLLELLSQDSVIVDFAIDSEEYGLFVVDNRLCTRI